MAATGRPTIMFTTQQYQCNTRAQWITWTKDFIPVKITHLE